MAVNGSTDFLSNCTSKYERNCSVEIFECSNVLLAMVLNGFSTALNLVFILPLNCWILWLARRAGVASSDFVILNQSIAEVTGNAAVVFIFLGAILNEKIITLISVYLGSSLVVGRPFFQAFYSVERYLAVVHPLIYMKYMKDPKLRMIFVCPIWLSILIIGWFVMDSYPRIPAFYIEIYLVMLVVCIFCSVMILWVLKRPKPGDGEKEGAYQMKKKAFIAVTLILISQLFGYGTVSCVILLSDKLPYDIYCVVLGFSWSTFIPNAAVQPCLYLSKIGKLPCIKKN